MRYLVVADRTATSPELVERIRELCAGDPEPTYVTLLIPARPASPALAVEAEAAANRTAQQATALFEQAGARTVWTVIGDISPLLAIEDELNDHRREYEALVLSTLPPGVSRWLRLDVHHQAARKFDISIIHVIAQSAAV